MCWFGDVPANDDMTLLTMKNKVSPSLIISLTTRLLSFTKGYFTQLSTILYQSSSHLSLETHIGSPGTHILADFLLPNEQTASSICTILYSHQCHHISSAKRDQCEKIRAFNLCTYQVDVSLGYLNQSISQRHNHINTQRINPVLSMHHY